MGFRRTVFRRVFLLSISASRSHLRYSTSSSSSFSESAAAPKTENQINLMVNYLINSLGFSREEAISVSSKCKVTNPKSIENAALVVKIFKNNDFDDTHIRDVVSSVPKILSCRATKTLEPKIRVFQDLGLSGSGLADAIKSNPSFLVAGLNSKIIPTVDFLKKVLGSDEKLIEALKRSNRLFASNGLKRITANVSLLRRYGFSDENVVRFMSRSSRNFVVGPKWLEDRLHWFEEKVGIPRNSPMFFQGMHHLASVNKSKLDKKIQIFGSFGWSESEISTLLRTQPLCLTYSEAAICNKLTYFMKELRYTPAYLARFNHLLTASLEKRVKPRNNILEILKEKKLVDLKPSLPTLAKYKESQFLRFVQRFKNKIPSLYETYITNIS